MEVQVRVVEFLSNSRDVMEGEPKNMSLNSLNQNVLVYLTISLRVYSNIDVLAGSTSIRYLTAIHSTWSCVKTESITVQAHSTRHSIFDE